MSVGSHQQTVARHSFTSNECCDGAGRDAVSDLLLQTLTALKSHRRAHSTGCKDQCRDGTRARGGPPAMQPVPLCFCANAEVLNSRCNSEHGSTPQGL
eukprot:4249482-Alexandrium_andersonii.AAC.1